MFKVHPVADPCRLQSVCAACGITPQADAFAYEMNDCESGALMGVAQFDIGAGEAKLLNLVASPGTHDTEAMFILGRAVLNFIDLCGVHLCLAPERAADVRLLHAIGFRRDEDGIWHCDTTGMFDGRCDGKPVQLP